MKTRPSSLFICSVYALLAISSLCFFSCGTTHKTTSATADVSDRGPRFLDDITVNPGDRVSSRNKSYGYTERTPKRSKDDSKHADRHLTLNEKTLVRKYAAMLGIQEDRVNNIDLIEEIDDWYGTPYRYGGSSKRGVDCSAFTRTLLNDVYNTAIPRTAEQQYEYCEPIKKSQLKQGDLVFFHTTSRSRVTHVGLYLQNGKFVHASTSSGVRISDLDGYYWRRTYKSAGRIPDREVSKE